MTVRDGAHGIAMGYSGRARRAQGQKIVPAHELLRRRLHSGFVQMPGHPGVISRVKRRVDGVVVDAVEVGFGMGRVPGMEVLRHHLRVQHPDVRRQMLVERQRELCVRLAVSLSCPKSISQMILRSLPLMPSSTIAWVRNGNTNCMPLPNINPMTICKKYLRYFLM